MTPRAIFKNPQLDGNTFYWEKGENAVLCLHGFTATTVEVKTIANALTQNGYSTFGPLLPGHGTTPEDANRTSWHDWVGSAESAYHFLEGKHRNIFVLGESMGGLIALYLCGKIPGIKGAMIFAPALHIRNLRLAKVMQYFVRYSFKKETSDTMLWQGYDVVPMKAAASLFDFQKHVRKELQHITQPVIIFQGSNDQTIDPMSSVYVLEHIGSSQKELVWLEESSHVILLDKQISDVEVLCLDFLGDILHGTSAELKGL